MDRREFVRTGGMLLAGTACTCGLSLLPACNSTTADVESPAGKRRWGMVIDPGKCKADCTACMDACKQENNITSHGDKRWDIHLIRKVRIKRKGSAHSAEKSVPLLCNHCDDPPCAQACPVQATYKREDGIVIVDHHRCIGCRYCMIACPYNARHFNFKENHDWPNKDHPRSAHGVPQSCTFCAHLLDEGEYRKQPACVRACPEKALVLGDLNDPDSEVSRLIAENAARGLREDLGTKPKVYYIGL